MSYVTIAKIQKAETTFTSVEEAVADLYNTLTEEIKSKLSQLKTDGKIVNEKFELDSDGLVHVRTFFNQSCFMEYVSSDEFTLGKQILSDAGYTINLIDQKEEL